MSKTEFQPMFFDQLQENICRVAFLCKAIRAMMESGMDPSDDEKTGFDFLSHDVVDRLYDCLDEVLPAKMKNGGSAA